MKNNKGFTLIEVVVSLAIMSIIFLITTNFLTFGMTTQKLSSDEANVQATMRLLSKNINNSIRNSAATFLLYKPTDRDLNQSDLTEGWNYIRVAKDGKSVLKYEWDKNQNKHIESTIMHAVEGTTFKIEYSKSNQNDNYSTDNLAKYNIIANVNGVERTLNSELEGLNSLQVIDRRTVASPSNTLAYRFGTRDAAFSETQAAVAMVLDRSGSMARNMKGQNTSNTKDQRIYKLKQEAIRLIEELQENPNIYISLNPFSSTANDSEPMIQASLNKSTDKPLTKIINNMTANGGTNTGDGVRRAFHHIKKFNDENEKDTDPKTINNFMIILVDGETTFGSIHQYSPKIFVTGDKNIDNYKVDTYNYYENGRYYGNGGSLDDAFGTAYVDLIGQMMQNYDSNMKVYVIGFTAESGGISSLKDIADATNAIGPVNSSKNYFEAGDEKVLKDIFTEIKKEINDSLWYIGGPS